MSGYYSSIRSELADSIRRFNASNTDGFEFGSIDLLLIHDPNCGPQNRLKMWKEFLKVRDEGLVKSVGVSNLCVMLNLASGMRLS